MYPCYNKIHILYFFFNIIQYYPFNLKVQSKIKTCSTYAITGYISDGLGMVSKNVNKYLENASLGASSASASNFSEFWIWLSLWLLTWLGLNILESENEALERDLVDIWLLFVVDLDSFNDFWVLFIGFMPYFMSLLLTFIKVLLLLSETLFYSRVTWVFRMVFNWDVSALWSMVTVDEFVICVFAFADVLSTVFASWNLNFRLKVTFVSTSIYINVFNFSINAKKTKFQWNYLNYYLHNHIYLRYKLQKLQHFHIQQHMYSHSW